LVGFGNAKKIKYRGSKSISGKGVEVQFIPGSIQPTDSRKNRLIEGITGYPESSPKYNIFGDIFNTVKKGFGVVTNPIKEALGKVPVISNVVKGAESAIATISTTVDGVVHHAINLLPHGNSFNPTFDPKNIIANLPKGFTDLPSIASDGYPIPGTDATLSFKPEVKPNFNLKGPYLPKVKIFPPGLSGNLGADITAGINLSGTATLNTGSIPGKGVMPTASFELAALSAPVPPPLTASASGSISVGQSIELTEAGLNKSIGFKVGASAGATLQISAAFPSFNTSPKVSGATFNPTATRVGSDDLTGIKYSASIGPGVALSMGLGAKIPGPFDCGVDLVAGNLNFDLPFGLEIESNKSNVNFGATLGVSADVLGIGCGPFSTTAFPFDIASMDLGPKAVIPIA
jgi:hypothetical protein